MVKQATQTFVCGFLIASASGAVAQERSIDEMLGSGNIIVKPSLEQQLEEKYKVQALKDSGVGMARFVLYPGRVWKNGKPTPEKADDLILLLHENGIEPMFLFAYKPKWNPEFEAYYDNWHRLGQAFAQRFAPNSEFLLSHGIKDWGVKIYSAVNEPDIMTEDQQQILTPTGENSYYSLLKGLADGVHSVDPELRVLPGGYATKNKDSCFDGYLSAVAPLLNDGTLDGIDLHRYLNLKQVTKVPYRWASQPNYEYVKENCGIDVDINHYTTEYNSKGGQITEEDAARLFLLMTWDFLGVQKSSGEPATVFAFPFEVVNVEWDFVRFGTQMNPWVPNLRGKTLQLVAEKAAGTRFVSSNPEKGVYVLSGSGKHLWVWQNWRKWTDQPGESFTLTDIPDDVKTVEVYGWDGLRKTVDVTGDAFTIHDLPTQETLMFVGSKVKPSEADNDFDQGRGSVTQNLNEKTWLSDIFVNLKERLRQLLRTRGANSFRPREMSVRF